MEIPILVSRSGFTAWGVELANDLGMTLIGRMRGERFLCLSGRERLLWDIKTSNSESVAEPKNSDLK
jgi:FdhD protein